MSKIEITTSFKVEQSGYHKDKERRKEYYLEYVHGWCLRVCTACNGSGYYDHNNSPKCGCCKGTGRERYPGPKSRSHIAIGDY